MKVKNAKRVALVFSILATVDFASIAALTAIYHIELVWLIVGAVLTALIFAGCYALIYQAKMNHQYDEEFSSESECCNNP